MNALFRTVTCVGLSALIILPLSGCQQFREESKTTRVDRLFAEWNRKDSPGCAVGISRNGAILYERGYGMADIDLGVPMTPSTVLAVASVSKSFTAMSVLLAVQNGKLSLDDEVQKYIPEWADKDDHITIRHLITHTSGLRDAFTLLGWSPIFGDVNKGIVTVLARQQGLNFPPGTEYSYNNGGYNLLASILERATGQPLRVFADANIFKPLGMTHSSFMDEPSTLMAGRAPGLHKTRRRLASCFGRYGSRGCWQCGDVLDGGRPVGLDAKFRDRARRHTTDARSDVHADCPEVRPNPYRSWHRRRHGDVPGSAHHREQRRRLWHRIETDVVSEAAFRRRAAL